MSATTIHPFEQAGLGLAPFRCIGVERRIGPIRTMLAGGITSEVGAPGQPMGTCDFCGTGIADCFIIESSDKKRFIVGCDCVLKTMQEAATTAFSREFATRQRELNAMKKASKLENDREKWADARAVLDANATLFTDTPHPMIKGKTLRDYFEFVFKFGGQSGKNKVSKAILTAKGGAK